MIVDILKNIYDTNRKEMSLIISL